MVAPAGVNEEIPREPAKAGLAQAEPAEGELAAVPDGEIAATASGRADDAEAERAETETAEAEPAQGELPRDSRRNCPRKGNWRRGSYRKPGLPTLSWAGQAGTRWRRAGMSVRSR